MMPSMNRLNDYPEGRVTADEARELRRAVADARRFRAAPVATVRCTGKPLFRSQLARDLGCLLDVDTDVVAWQCLPCVLSLPTGSDTHGLRVPDFRVHRVDGSTVLMDVVSAPAASSRPVANQSTHPCSQQYEPVPEDEIRSEPRLSNARELLRYAGVEVPLGDRIRFLAMLEENGPTPISECLRGCRGAVDPISMIAVLALRRFICLDLDEAPIGPETVIRRLRD